MDINTILVVMDPTKTEQAIVGRCMNIAKAFDARVELFEAEFRTALESSYPFDTHALQQAREAYLSKRRRVLEEVAAQFASGGVQASVHVCWERPLYSAILERAGEIDADLIVKATHHHSLLNRALFTNTDWHLIREADVPLWFVREEHEWGSHLELMAAVDPLSFSEGVEKLNPKILTLAHQISSNLPSTLSVGHAYEPIPTGMLLEFDTVVSDYESYRDQVQAEHQQALDRLLEEYVEPTTQVYFEEGAPDRFLPDCVNREGIDILVMGAVSRDGFDRLFIGSTAERVLEHIQCDVVVVK
ncbi:universal stress protein UspA [Hahella sp. CCB-MM4]|uniref:universal stress protein n=1 Tax=Hahella sp. (strain CCB-MM4) TaxID=1926491 RepID=UPI000B9C72AB|nr:universal stress protein [Hahella sp. CCB-MM4]OZG72083.1 universal stress protein UspA [Hahella sp. CCB-MM4]